MADNVEIESGANLNRSSFRIRITDLFYDYWIPLKLYFMSFPAPMMLWDNRNFRCETLGIVVENLPEPSPIDHHILIFTQTQPHE